ncbi:MAG: TonB-dependent receptor [Bacteroidota bacterium]|jgi:outer membrane receptor for ferrienterochelin and colicins|nr:TonB-dependent receptor [Bacteroidota bacterium]
MRSKYISKLILLCAIIIISNINVFSQDEDSIKTIEMKEVMVSANKTEKPFVELTVPAKIISKKEIENSGHSRLDEIISEQVGIITVPGFGGSEGIQLQGIDPEYTLILIDGLPVIGRVAGILDLSRISLASVERIEIVKGASSSLYGSEALGGVVNIITTKGKDEGFKKKVYYQYGSYNTQDILADISYRKKRVAIFGNINRYSSDGYDLIEGDGQNTVEPFQNITGSLGLSYDMNKLGNLNLIYKLFEEDREGTVFITSPGIENKSETNENNISLKYQNQLSKSVDLNIDLYKTNYLNKEQQVISNGTINTNNFDQSLNRLDIRLKHSTSTGSYYTIGFGYDNEKLERTNISVKPEHKSQFLYFQYDWNTNDKFNLVSGIRYDNHNKYSSQLSPKVSFKYDFSEDLNLKGSFGYGYKTPDFRQLYLNFSNSTSGYIVLGASVIDEVITELQNNNELMFYNELFTTDLTAENSNSYNLGLQYYVTPDIPLEINLFRNNIYNLIETNIVGRKNNGQTIYSYSNVNKAFTQGVEIQGSWSPIKKLTFNGGYQLLYAKDLEAIEDFKSGSVFARDKISKQSFELKPKDYFGLYGRSRHQLNIGVNYYMNQNKDNLNLRFNYRGKFALVDSNNNSFLDKYDSFIEGHLISNISYNKYISKNLSLQLYIKNLLGYKDVENLLNNPGRVYSFKVILKN